MTTREFLNGVVNANISEEMTEKASALLSQLIAEGKVAKYDEKRVTYFTRVA